MITASNELKTLLKESHYFNTAAGCTIEYNWNQMTTLDNESVTSSGYWANSNNVYPFKKLFPMDSIIKPFRPNAAGIKYAIIDSAGSGIEGETKVYKPSGLTYPQKYRIYYPAVDNVYKYWISKKDEDNQYLAVTYPKDIVTNKVVVKFEISHSIPASFNVVTAASGITNFNSPTTIFSGTSSNVPTFSATKPGALELYYNGSSWSTDETTLNPSSYTTIRGIKLNLTSITGYVGVIEISPRWVKDISDLIQDFSIAKESSSSSDDIIPVGYVSSNSLQMNVFNYNTSAPQILTYTSATSVDASKVYMYKNAELRPYIKVIHASGALGSGSDKHDKIYQGYFYIQSWSDTYLNEISLTALDGAKALQDTVCPPILCHEYSASAIIRRLLDSIGFTTYNFNFKEDDKSVISVTYWWTEANQTVWDSIQELCRDTQMTAVFDESGILQFYTRQYMYDDSKTASWPLTFDADGSTLANIEDISKKDIPVANQVKILWSGATTSEFYVDDQPLWSADPTSLAGAGLQEDLSSTAVSTTGSPAYISVKPISPKDSGILSLLSYAGYLAIDDEILEYDAIQYSYIPVSGPANGSPVFVDVTSPSDLLKYQSLSHPGSTAFHPTGKYRIKARGSFGTTAAAHKIGRDDTTWSVMEISIK